MAQIDVQITFDAESILKAYTPGKDPDNPTVVDPKYIFMVVANDEAVSGNGGGSLTIKARTRDTIFWSEATPGVDYSTILYAFISPPLSPGQQPLISQPQPEVVTVTVPLPNEKTLTKPDKQTVKDFFWSCDVKNPSDNAMAYHFHFMIVDRDGNTKGYFSWDPWIKITT